jgi:hypothetical protein
MENSRILEIVNQIRKDYKTKSQNEQITEYKDFFDNYPSIFFMARDPNMNIETLRYLLDLKHQIDIGKLKQEEMDRIVGQIFYDKYVHINE